MNTLIIKTKNTSYPIYTEISFAGIKKAFEDAGLTNRKVMIITDNNVEKLYLEEIKAIVESVSKEVFFYAFEPGENSKNLDTVSKMYAYMLSSKIDRKSVVIALGGGVVGDMAGFAAATFMRGIKYIQIPTTLLSQVDSSVGGKVGVDFQGGKNIIGAFYQPAFVYANVNTLKSLPEREFIAGLGEVVKHGLIMDKNYYKYIEENRERIKHMEDEALLEIVRGSCRIKAEVVNQDETEQGVRAILNFGHTFGHAVESLSDFTLVHGECVAIGSMAGLYLSQKYGHITQAEAEAVKELFGFFKMLDSTEGFDSEQVYRQMFHDKKTVNNQLMLVLLEKIGKAYTTRNTDEEDIREAIDYMLQKK